MKLVYKLFIVVVALALSTLTYAQSFEIKPGIRAGLNLTKMMDKDDDQIYSDDYNLKPGFQMGPIVEIKLTKLLAIETGLLLSTKGYRYKNTETYGGVSYKYTETASLVYFDCPITAKLNFQLGELTLYGALGPYIGVGLSGKYKSKSSGGGNTETDSEPIKWGSDPDVDHLKRPDVGLYAGAGVELKNLQFGLSYQLGANNILADTGNGAKAANRVLAFTAAYKFSFKK
jgi:hypothetical protein